MAARNEIQSKLLMPASEDREKIKGDPLAARTGNFFKNIPAYFVPKICGGNPEAVRKARLIINFGFLGAVFGFSYAGFYLVIGHMVGAAIIIVCSVSVALVPVALRITGQLRTAGNFYAFILTMGFLSLSLTEGGANGHAVAWLVSVPLCALLLADRASALVWCAVCVAGTAYFCALEFRGIELEPCYPPQLHAVITTVGFIGLLLFMFILGNIFEIGRKNAFQKLQNTLAELSQANDQLRLLHQEKNEYLGIAAHDLKNQLQVAVGFAEIITLSRQPVPEKVKEDAGQILKMSEKMYELISNLLKIQSLEEGKFQLVPQMFDIAESARDTVAAFQPAAAHKNITISFAAPARPLPVFADPKAARQVMENILSNAVKYSPQGKRIFASIAEKDGRCIFSVKDEGPGLSAEDMKRLFGKFARLSAIPTGGESSTGLGLSIVKKIVEAMDGTVRCESVPGSGATFIVTLPSGGRA
jgi:signal transduction histidine kinase